MYLRITEQERAAIVSTRNPYGGERTKEQKSAQVAAFRAIKRRLGLDDDRKIKIEIDVPSNPDYLVVKDSLTGRSIPDPAAAQPAPVYRAPPAVKVDEPRNPPVRMGATPPAAVSGGPVLKVASISIDDALELLRAEGDMCTSFAQTTRAVTGSVSIEDGRLYFVV